MTEEPEIEKAFICSCHGEGLVVRRFKDESLVWVSLWGGRSYGRGWRWRVRAAWDMLRHGYSWDEVCFTEATAHALSEELGK
jgi:hypothetical protein